jgi:hypothetical protein
MLPTAPDLNLSREQLRQQLLNEYCVDVFEIPSPMPYINEFKAESEAEQAAADLMFVSGIQNLMEKHGLTEEDMERMGTNAILNLAQSDLQF